MSLPLFQIDAFADRPFTGNPAAVCLLETPASAEWMQSVAMEMNLSETAFLLREGDAWRLRWFTPTVEVDLCGHATVAAAHALWEAGRLAADESAHFLTRSGPLTARKLPSQISQPSALNSQLIQIDLPVKQVTEAAPPDGLLESLGVTAVAVGRNQFDWLVEVATAAEVRGCQPDQRRLRTLGARGVILTSRSDDDPRFDFLSRFFAPGSGIDEDPVTGSAHCALAPWWAAKLGKTEFTAFQASARGGILGLVLAGDRVRIAGGAVTVFRGELLGAAAFQLPSINSRSDD